MLHDPHNLLPLAHPDLERLFNAVGAQADIQIVTTYRSNADQQTAYDNGTSHAKPGQSPHNFILSLAVDAVPLPLDWKNVASFKALADHVQLIAVAIGVGITWGGTFKRLADYDHFELRNWQQIVMQDKP